MLIYLVEVSHRYKLFVIRIYYQCFCFSEKWFSIMSFNLTVYGYSDNTNKTTDMYEHDIEQDASRQMDEKEGFISSVFLTVVLFGVGVGFIVLGVLLMCFDPIGSDLQVRHTCLRKSRQLWTSIRTVTRYSFQRIRQLGIIFYEPVHANDDEGS